MTTCHHCEEPIDAGSVTVESINGDRARLHGTCFTKRYTAQAFNEDQPKKWTQKAHYHYTLDEHVEALIADETEPSETYEW